MGPLDRKLLRDLWRIKTQGVAIALVVACGVATVLMSFGALQSLRETRAAYYDRYRFADVFVTVRRAPQWLADHIAVIPGVSRVETRVVRDVVMDVPGVPEPSVARLISLPRHGEPVLNALALREGRLVEPSQPDEVVASENFAAAMGFHPGDTVEAVINGRKRRSVIVGVALSPEYVYSLGPGQLMPDDRRFAVLWMGREALEAVFDLDGAFNDLSVKLSPGASEAEVIRRIDALVEPYGGVGAHGRADQLSHAFLSGELDQLQAIGSIIPPIFLGIAAFLVNMVMTRLIETEREQIGLLKAFGYANRDVGAHYLKLVVVLAALGVAIGFAVGTWLGRAITELYTEFYRFPLLLYRPSLWLYPVAGGLAVAAAGVGALTAVARAVALAPAVAMAPAPPVAYSSPLLRFGLELPISLPTRMVLRHIVRWPVRAALTTLGIAMAVALLVTSLFSFDAINRTIEVHYFLSQRQDATVGFVEPVERRVLHDLEHLPGIVAAEGVRTVPVRLRAGPRSELVGLRGIDPAARLTQLLDIDLQPVIMPDWGLVLSDKLAEVLAVTTGETVRVEALQGRRPAADLPVVAVVREYIGTEAYISIDALNRFMRDSPVISAAHLVIDPARQEELFRALKQTPVAASVTLRQTAVQSFRDTMAETMTTVVSFYVAFAGIIAFGVIYNSARITFSERARELASLRVLGFTRGEVTYILLGELGLLTVLAMPLGCLIGAGIAWMVAQGLDTELFRIPFVIEDATYGAAVLTVGLSAVASAAVVARRIGQMDLVAVLKTRE